MSRSLLMMHAFLVVSYSKDNQEKEVQKILAISDISSFDIHRIKPENSIGIEEIRKLKITISLKPFKSQTKAVVIEEAQKLTIEAQNALLKTLEEPPDHTIIVLTATNKELLLPTIVSRCQVIQLSTVNNQQTGDQFTISNLQFPILLGEKLKLAEELAKDKETALLWLSNMISAARTKLLKEISGSKNHPLISQHLNILISFKRAHILLSTTNVNPRFTLENLFLSLK
ncbi:hypothetical protein HYT17_00335 [Candidatus Microgenomates bacterium]|nr:hypothetical protein [Candidatus Microgenomates bacterium]